MHDAALWFDPVGGAGERTMASDGAVAKWQGACPGEVWRMYTVSVRLADGDWMAITTIKELHEAVSLAFSLNGHWPQKYVVRDAQGRVVYPPPERPEEGSHFGLAPQPSQ